MNGRRLGYRTVVQRLADEGNLAPGWSVDEAGDFLWALLSIHTYEYLVIDRGWSLDRYVEQLTWVARRTLLRDER